MIDLGLVGFNTIRNEDGGPVYPLVTTLEMVVVPSESANSGGFDTFYCSYTSSVPMGSNQLSRSPFPTLADWEGFILPTFDLATATYPEPSLEETGDAGIESSEPTSSTDPGALSPMPSPSMTQEVQSPSPSPPMDLDFNMPSQTSVARLADPYYSALIT